MAGSVLLRQPTGQKLSNFRRQQKKISIGPILFLYYEESLVSSNLNSKQLRFHGAHPNVHCAIIKMVTILRTSSPTVWSKRLLMRILAEFFFHTKNSQKTEGKTDRQSLFPFYYFQSLDSVWKEIAFSKFSCMFLNPNIFSNLNSDCSALLDIRNLQKQVKKTFCYQKLFSLEFQKFFSITRTIFSHNRTEQFW